MPSAPSLVRVSPGRQRGLFIVLGAMCALGPMTVDMYLPALPQIVRDLDSSEAAVQATLTGSLIGMAIGQLVFGPLSDSIGRRKPLVIGLTMHVLFSVLSAFAVGIGPLILFRTLQGVGSAAAPAIAMAIVRDVSVGRAASIRYSTIMFVSTAAPIIAPLLGSALLLTTSWHGIFVVQAVLSTLLVLLALLLVPETRPAQRPARRHASPEPESQDPESHESLSHRTVPNGIVSLVKDRVFVGAALSQSAMMAASFCYISGLSFVAQDWYGVSEQAYGLILAGGAVTMLLMNRVSPVLLRRFSPHKVAIIGLAGAMCSAGLMMLAAPAVGLIGVAAFSWLCIGFQQLVTPNNQALGLSKHGPYAGVASAIIGSASMIAAAGAAPLMGILGVDDGFIMATGMITFYAVSMLASIVVIGFRHEHGETHEHDETHEHP